MDIIIIGLIGWLCGRIVNYLSDVLPVRRKITYPICAQCFKTQPIWKYMIFHHRCPHCGFHRPFLVWVVEALYIGLSIILWVNPSGGIGYFLNMLLLVYFGVVVVIDLKHRVILHPVSWTGMVLCLGIGCHLYGIWISILGGVVGYLIMLVFYHFGRLLGGWVSKFRGEILDEEPLGFGDVNLAGVLGLLLGWPGILGGLLLAVIIGGIVSIFYLLGMIFKRRYQVFSTVPYGPFLIASAVLLLYFKDIFYGIFD